MVRPLTAPWILRTAPRALEVRLLVRLPAETALDPRRTVEAEEIGISPGTLGLEWQALGPAEEAPVHSADLRPAGARRAGSPAADLRPARLRATRLGPDVALASFPADAAEVGTGGRYRIHCGALCSAAMPMAPDPGDGETWRLLILSDHQSKPGVRATLRSVARVAGRQPIHGILFAGDLVDVPDDPDSWFGRPDGLSFFDSMAAPVQRIFGERGGCEGAGWTGGASAGGAQRSREALERVPRSLLSSAPILACPGNHEVSATEGATPRERFQRVQPADWNIDTFARLFLPPQMPAGWFAASWGPLRVLSLFVCRHWVPGDHEKRRGPCYASPGRFIFEPFHPGSPQYRWLAAQTDGERWAQEADSARGSRPLQVVLLHHAPFAQGHNALPLFGEPVAYRESLIAKHLVPLFGAWADLVLSGHNHAVNHHRIGGVHYFESSHIAAGYTPARRLPDGSPAVEPLGHPASFFASEPEQTFFSLLEVTAGGRARSARVSTRRVFPGGHSEEEYRFDL